MSLRLATLDRAGVVIVTCASALFNLWQISFPMTKMRAAAANPCLLGWTAATSRLQWFLGGACDDEGATVQLPLSLAANVILWRSSRGNYQADFGVLGE